MLYFHNAQNQYSKLLFFHYPTKKARSFKRALVWLRTVILLRLRYWVEGDRRSVVGLFRYLWIPFLCLHERSLT